MKETESRKSPFQQKLSDYLMSAFDSVIKKKADYYANNKNIYGTSDVKKIVSKCGNMNALISGGAGLIPGPIGMMIVAPEISLIIKNQIEMIYDIGKAYNKTGKELSKELVIGVFASSIGNTGIGLITIHAGQVLVRRASVKVLQKIIIMLGGKVTQRLLRAIVAKWLPGIGAIAMAIWSKYTTNLIGEKAREIFSKDIIFEEGEFIDIPDDVVEVAETAEEIIEIINKNKIHILSNLAKVGGDIDDIEKKKITQIIKSMNFKTDLSSQLIDSLGTMDQKSVDFDLLKENQVSISFLEEMISLALVKTKFHKLKKVFIRKVGKKLGIDNKKIEELLNKY